MRTYYLLFALGIVFVTPITLLRAQPAAAEQNKAADTKAPAKQELPPSLAIKIADEPRAIDTATLVPPKLAARATVRFDDKSLQDVIDWLKAQQIDVQVDQKELAEANILLSEQLTERLDNEPIFLLLERLKTLGLGWYIAEDQLQLTVYGAAKNQLNTVPYMLSDLFDAGYPRERIVSTITNTIRPQSWRSQPVVLGDVLFVRQNQAVQHEVAGLLSALRKHGRRTVISDLPAHEVLRKKLEEPITVKFRDIPLATAVAELSKAAQCEIRLDLVTLREKKVRDRAPVSADAKDQKLKNVLRGMLAELKLTWILRDGVLWITAPSTAETQLLTAVYDVRDLCRDFGESAALESAIVSQSKGPWDNKLITGRIAFARPGVMVVHHTQDQQDEVLQLLENYRTALRNSKPREQDSRKDRTPVTHYYRVPSVIAEQFEKYLPATIKPETWKNDKQPKAIGTIKFLATVPGLRDAQGKAIVTGMNEAAGDRLLVVPYTTLAIEQTPEIHQEIADLLYKIERGDAPVATQDGGSGLGGGLGGAGGFGGGFFSVPVK
jgi:hypothetical protein